MSILSVLGIVFITLKLVGVIGWSWWLVTLPFWGGAALFLIFVSCAGIFSALTK